MTFLKLLRHKGIRAYSHSPKIKTGAPDRPTHLIFVVLPGSCVSITPIELQSLIRADVPAPAVAEIATSASDKDAAAAAPASATTPATAAETAAAKTATAATPSLR
jgi:hypothetical protein